LYIYRDNTDVATADSFKIFRAGRIADEGTHNDFSTNEWGVQIGTGETPTDFAEIFRVDSTQARIASAYFDETDVWGGSSNKSNADWLLSESDSHISNWDILTQKIRSEGDGSSAVEMISGSTGRPGFYFAAENGEELWLGGDYSFDAENDIDLGSTGISITADTGTVSNGSSNIDTASGTHTETGLSTYVGRAFSLVGGASVSISTTGIASGIANIKVTIEFRDASNNVLETVTQDGQSTTSTTLSISLSRVIPENCDNALITVDLSATASAQDGVDNTASASITYNGTSDTMEVIGVNEFVSPLGFSFVNEEESTATRKPRVLGIRETGRLLGHQVVIEGEDGEQVKHYISGGTYYIEDVNGSVLDSWPVGTP
jgi:hypothetical protein